MSDARSQNALSGSGVGSFGGSGGGPLNALPASNGLVNIAPPTSGFRGSDVTRAVNAQAAQPPQSQPQGMFGSGLSSALSSYGIDVPRLMEQQSQMERLNAQQGPLGGSQGLQDLVDLQRRGGMYGAANRGWTPAMMQAMYAPGGRWGGAQSPEAQPWSAYGGGPQPSQPPQSPPSSSLGPGRNNRYDAPWSSQGGQSPLAGLMGNK